MTVSQFIKCLFKKPKDFDTCAYCGIKSRWVTDYITFMTGAVTSSDACPKCFNERRTETGAINTYRNKNYKENKDDRR